MAAACNSVFVLKAWGLPLERCLVPVMATNGPDEKHGVVYLLENGLPCVATLAPLLCLLRDAGRREAAAWRLRICRHVASQVCELQRMRDANAAWIESLPITKGKIESTSELNFKFGDAFFCKTPARLHHDLEEASLAAQLRVFACLQSQGVVMPLTALSFITVQGSQQLQVANQAILVFPNMVKKGFTVGLPAPQHMASWLRCLWTAVTRLHGAGVVHLDLHRNNTMFRLAADGAGVDKLMLIDLDSALLFKEDEVRQDVIDNVQRNEWRNAYPHGVLEEGGEALLKADWYFVAAVLLGHLRGRTEEWVKGTDGANARAVAIDDLRLYLEEHRDTLMKCLDDVQESLDAGVEIMKANGLVAEEAFLASA